METTETKQTNPIASGGSTTEGKLTIGVVGTSLLVALAGAVVALHEFLSDQQTNNPGDWRLLLGMTLAGLLSAGLASFGYVKGRSVLKSNMLLGALQAGAPVLLDAINKGLKQRAAAIPGTSNPPLVTGERVP